MFFFIGFLLHTTFGTQVILFQFSLETFVEKRKVGYEYKPYKGGEIDDPSKGRAPECWEMEVKLKEMFKKQDEKKEVPHTSSVRVGMMLSAYMSFL